jgi:hypothetical protein
MTFKAVFFVGAVLMEEKESSATYAGRFEHRPPINISLRRL